jgi:hypothetical protein
MPLNQADSSALWFQLGIATSSATLTSLLPGSVAQGIRKQQKDGARKEVLT